MEKVKKFLEELRDEPEFAEILLAEAPKNFDEFKKLLASQAEKLGRDVTESEISAFFEMAFKERAEKSEAAEKIVAEADDELGAVAGGAGDDTPENGCGVLHTLRDLCRSMDYIASPDGIRPGQLADAAAEAGKACGANLFMDSIVCTSVLYRID